MKQPVLIGEVIEEILDELRARNLDLIFDEEWTDVTDFLRLPSLRSIELSIHLGNGTIIPHRLNGRTYAKRSELEAVFGTSDFTVKIRKRHGKK
jgi:hypothetical protein